MDYHLSHIERSKIAILYEDCRWSATKIANYMNINRHTVSLWISRYKETNTIDEKNKTGKKRKTSKEQDLHIINIVKNKNSNFIIDNIKEEINKINIHLCNNTIISRLKEYGFYSSYPFKKPFLTEEHKRKRLEFTLENYYTNWVFVIFSDETTIVKEGNFSKKVWISSEVDNVIRKKRHSIKRNLYGCISIGGIETFNIFTENMNADKYIEIIERNLLDIYDDKYLYQQDNSPIHKAKKSLKCMNDNNIRILSNWPPNSPDLNPIENLWYLLKLKLSHDIITADNFNKKIENRLNEIKYEHIFNMISSMPIRISKVIQRGGDYIDY